ncbi:hypothetical protein VPH35_140982 [Triticum aestivum]
MAEAVCLRRGMQRSRQVWRAIQRLMAEVERLQREASHATMVAARAVRNAEMTTGMAREARMLLVRRAMSRSSQEERNYLFAMEQPLTPDLILRWVAEEASTSRAQRAKWRPFRSSSN